MENQVTEQILAEQPAPMQKNESIDQKVGFWEYLGLIVLFSIPVVGFIAAIIFLYAPKRRNLKNFAGAMLTWLVVRAVAALIALVIAISFIGGLLVPIINETLGTQFQDFGEALDIIGSITSGNYSGLIDQMSPQLEEILGEEYLPLLEELATGEYDDLIRDIVNQDYADALKDLKEGDYPQLQNVLSKEDYNGFMNELEKAANGEYSDFFGQVQSFVSDTMTE